MFFLDCIYNLFGPRVEPGALFVPRDRFGKLAEVVFHNGRNQLGQKLSFARFEKCGVLFAVAVKTFVGVFASIP